MLLLELNLIYAKTWKFKMEERLLEQQELFKNMILIQLEDDNQAEYKDLKNKGLLSEFVEKKSKQMIDELNRILSETDSSDIQSFYEAVEIVTYNHIVEENTHKIYSDDIMEEDIDDEIENKILTSDDIVDLLYPELTESIWLKSKWEILNYREYGVIFVNDNLRLIDIDGYMAIFKKIERKTLSKETIEINLDKLENIILYVNPKNFDIVLRKILEDEKEQQRLDYYNSHGLERKLIWFIIWSLVFALSFYFDMGIEIQLFLFLPIFIVGAELYPEWKKSKLRDKKSELCSEINILIRLIGWNRFTNTDIDNLVLMKKDVKYLFPRPHGIIDKINEVLEIANSLKEINIELENLSDSSIEDKVIYLNEKKESINKVIYELSKKILEDCKKQLV